MNIKKNINLSKSSCMDQRVDGHIKLYNMLNCSYVMKIRELLVQKRKKLKLLLSSVYNNKIIQKSLKSNDNTLNYHYDDYNGNDDIHDEINMQEK